MKFNLNWRIWILIAVLVLSALAISPQFGQTESLAISAVIKDSAAAAAGLQGPTNVESPVSRERIISLNGFGVPDENAYHNALATIRPGSTVQLQTTKESYVLHIPEEADNIADAVGLRTTPAASSNIRKGLDLTGGARVLLTPKEPIAADTLDLVLENINQRLNVFGLSDVIVRPTKDFDGNQFILVEIAGANEREIVELLSSQGNFEAKIGETTVFTGGDDVTYVGRSASDSGIQTCSPGGELGHSCRFFFVISLSAEAAQRQAAATRALTILPNPSGEAYLSEPLDLYLDGENLSSLQIAASLQGRAETQIQISGSGSGATQEAAVVAAQAEMKQLQTLLTTGSLPVELEIVKTDAISPLLGPSFIRNILLVGLIAIIAVILVVVTRYRDWRISIPMVVTMFSELVIILGIASLIRWNLDLAAIAGIIIAIGTGVDDQIIIVDEIKSTREKESWLERMKKAFFIIFAAFFTLLAAMLPLMWAGAGLVRGFAITTILGVTVGVLVTRPAFAAIAEMLIKDKGEDA